MERQDNFNNNLKVSVVLTVFNESETIKNVITNLFFQSRRPDEIVVCDGGSSDDTVKKLDGLLKEGLPLKIVIGKELCRGAGRNRAISSAAYPLIALTDAGTSAHPDWLENILTPHLLNPDVQIVYGTVMPKLENRFSRCLAALIIGSLNIEGRLCPSVASLFFSRKIWQEAGGFPEGLTTLEDLIFLERLKETKAVWVKAKDAVVEWQLPANLSSVFRRFSAYSNGSLAAGFARQWHYGTVRNCIILVILLFLGIMFSSWFLLGIVIFQLLRSYRYLSCQPWLKQLGFRKIFGDYIFCSFLLWFLDLATLNGLQSWILKDHCRRKEITRIK